MDSFWIRSGLAASVSILVGYLAFQESGLTAGVIVAVFSGVIAFSLSSGRGAWNSIAALKNPAVGFFVFFMFGFIYFVFRGEELLLVVLKSLGGALIGSALSMILFNYWHIGS